MNDSKKLTGQMSIPGLPEKSLLVQKLEANEPGGMLDILEKLQAQNRLVVNMSHRDLVGQIGDSGDRLVTSIWTEARALRAAAHKLMMAAQRELEARASQ